MLCGSIAQALCSSQAPDKGCLRSQSGGGVCIVLPALFQQCNLSSLQPHFSTGTGIGIFLFLGCAVDQRVGMEVTEGWAKNVVIVDGIFLHAWRCKAGLICYLHACELQKEILIIAQDWAGWFRRV